MFRNLSTRTCKILFSSRINIVSSFKKTKVELEISIEIEVLLMVEKGIRGGIYHSIIRYAKANNKYVKDYNENK